MERPSELIAPTSPKANRCDGVAHSNDARKKVLGSKVALVRSNQRLISSIWKPVVVLLVFYLLIPLHVCAACFSPIHQPRGKSIPVDGMLSLYTHNHPYRICTILKAYNDQIIVLRDSMEASEIFQSFEPEARFSDDNGLSDFSLVLLKLILGNTICMGRKFLKGGRRNLKFGNSGQELPHNRYARHA